jgi:hypothetical protein
LFSCAIPFSRRRREGRESPQEVAASAFLSHQITIRNNRMSESKTEKGDKGEKSKRSDTCMFANDSIPVALRTELAKRRKPIIRGKFRPNKYTLRLKGNGHGTTKSERVR